MSFLLIHEGLYTCFHPPQSPQPQQQTRQRIIKGAWRSYVGSVPASVAHRRALERYLTPWSQSKVTIVTPPARGGSEAQRAAMTFVGRRKQLGV